MNQYNTDKQNLRIKFLMLGGLINLVKKKDDAAISDIEGKCFTTSDDNNFTSGILDVWL